MDQTKKLTKTKLVNLVDVIDNLRKNLLEAKEKAEKVNHGLKFTLEEIEVELQTVIEDSDTGDGGFDFKIIKFGGSKTDTDSRTQRIKFKLVPEVIPKKGETTDGKETSKLSINAAIND